jgi:signal peptidase I
MTEQPPIATPAAARGRGRSTLRVACSIVGWILVGLLAATWFVTLRPHRLGGPAEFVGVNGISMTPTLHDGDLVVVRRHAEYHVGDIVAFRVPADEPGAGTGVIHRIVGVDGDGAFVTRGDHNDYDDFWRPRVGDIYGKVWLHVPKVAAWLSRLHSPLGFAVLVGIATFVAAAWAMRPAGDALDRSEPALEDLAETSATAA